MLIADLQRRLDAHANAKSRDWWNRYLKGVIPFRGIGVPGIREVVAEWRDATAPVGEQFEMAMALFREPFAEDKLAGILYLQNHLAGEIDWREAIPRFEELFDEGHIFDWSTTDWFCVRVLGPMIERNGLACAKAIAAWHDAENLWRARSSAVGFVNLVADKRWHPLIERSCTTLINRDERFAKTAVGWVMRELSKHDPKRVRKFVDKHRKHFSNESLKAATKWL